MPTALASKLLFLFFVLINTYAVSQNQAVCDATLENPCVVLDKPSKLSSLKNLRDASMIASAYSGNVIGIKKLNISASEQPSEKGWKDISAYIAKQRTKGTNPVLVLDLRQESHGYINGKPITLASSYNWVNLGKTNSQSSRDQENWLDALRLKRVIAGILNPDQYLNKEYSQGTSFAVASIKNEEYYVYRLGFNYRRLFISDHHHPLDSEVDEFIKIIKAQPKNSWLHVHCRGGKGRTTTILAMYDMIKNANKVSFEEIIARQASIPPYYNLLEINRAEPILTPYYYQRLVFLRYFYKYAQQFLAGYEGSWSEWRTQNI